jgi:hypothetical protein
MGDIVIFLISGFQHIGIDGVPGSKGGEELIRSRDQSPIRSKSSHYRKLSLEAHAFGDLKGRDDTSLDLLAALSSTVRRDFGKRFCGIRKRFLVDVGIAKEGPAPKRRSPVFSFGNLELW